MKPEPSAPALLAGVQVVAVIQVSALLHHLKKPEIYYWQAHHLLYRQTNNRAQIWALWSGRIRVMKSAVSTTWQFQTSVSKCSHHDSCCVLMASNAPSILDISVLDYAANCSTVLSKYALQARLISRTQVSTWTSCEWYCLHYTTQPMA